MFSRFHKSFLLSILVLASIALPSFAEVRLGKNVRIGGHDASNQTFDKNNRGEYYIYDGKPPKQGCYMRKNADGSRSKVCHLKRKGAAN